jgi:hypothetical protein
MEHTTKAPTAPIPTTSVEVDTELADLYCRRIEAGQVRESNAYILIRLAGGIVRERHHKVATITVEEALERGPEHKYETYNWEYALGKYQKAVDEVEAICQRESVLNAEWEREQWSRFFIVRNNNGHIHSSLYCSTCYPTTQYGWLPELSGLSEADAVESQGSILCSVCFPSAPVEWTNGESKASAEAKAERARAKAEREAKRLEKALLPDGSELRVGRDWLKTQRAAEIWLTDFADWGWSDEERLAQRQQVLKALAVKVGKTTDEVWADALARLERRRGRK